jgi:uncharacterized protein DUF1800
MVDTRASGTRARPPDAGSGPVLTGPGGPQALDTAHAAPGRSPAPGGHRRAGPARPAADRIVRALGTGRAAAHRLLRGRRRVLLALGGGVLGAGSLASTVAAVFGQDLDPDGVREGAGSPRDAGSFADRDASYVSGMGDVNDLGAAGVADTPSQAAAAALKATPKYPTPLSRDPVLHLLRRVTFGPTTHEVAAVRELGIDAWLDRQLQPETIPDPDGDRVVAAFPSLRLSTAQIRAGYADRGWDAMWELGRGTLGRQVWSSRQLLEVMVDFWSNHLNVTNPFDGGADTRTAYDRDVIRAHALGRFADMLRASARSPAMMRYLNNDRSDRRSVNENYGRELLELHTVGIDGGYTEADVRNSAYILTGRTVDADAEFRYDPRKHWVGRVKVLQFSHANGSAAGGLSVGEAYLAYLARHPSTATNIARKLAVRFVCDTPPAALVQRLAREYLASDTAIGPVLRLLFRSLEFWIATGLKTRRPLENVVATMRTAGVAPGEDTPKALEGLYWLLHNLGHAPLAWVPPNGYPDVAGAWSSAYATLGTWNSHRAVVQGWYKGLAYPRPEQLVSSRPATTGAYLDALAARLLYQPLRAGERAALLKFLGAGEGSRADATLGGKLPHLAPLLLDSIYHALR